MAKIIILQTNDGEQLLPATSSAYISYIGDDGNETLDETIAKINNKLNIDMWEEYTPE